MIRTIYKKDGSFNAKTEKVISHIKALYEENGNPVRIHAKSWSGRGAKAKLINKEWDYVDLLNEFNIHHRFGNDAPRGGVTGDFVEFRIDMRNKLWKKVFR